MADNYNDDAYNEDDEDLLSQIRRWTEKTQHEKAARAGSMGEPARAVNPWAPPELMAAADRALEEEPRGGLPVPRAREAQPVRPAYNKNASGRGVQKKHPVRRFLAVALVLALLLGLGGYIAAFAVAGKVDRRPIGDGDRSALFAAATGTTRVTNILLLGLDTEEGGRTDTMLLLSVDRVHRKLKLTSFLRDSWLNMPNGKAAKLNTAIHQGGPAAVMRAVGENFSVRVDHYMMVNFSVFQQVVDALGGVSVAITDKEADYLCKTAGPFKRMGREEIRRQMDKSGAVKLDGLEALVYCRIRKLDDDFQRTARQRKFMESLVRACKRNPLRLLGLVTGDALSSVETDMSQAQLANLAAMAPLLLGYSVEEFTVPAQGTWKYATKQGTSAITLDVQANAAKLRTFIYE